MAEAPSFKRPGYRLGHLSGFIPVNEETIMSTRGQTLPSLLQNRSSTSLFGMRERRSTYSRLLDEETNGNDPSLHRQNSNVDHEARRHSIAPDALTTPQMRSMRLIGNPNPRYQWEQYYKSKEELKQYKKSVRQYYERNNFLISSYMFIDKILDSSLPHHLIQEYHDPAHSSNVDVPNTITEEPQSTPSTGTGTPTDNGLPTSIKIKRTPKALYRVPTNENTPLLGESPTLAEMAHQDGGGDEDVDSQSRIVTIAIFINFVANFLLLVGKIAVIVLTSSLSVLASLVDAALDFLSTAIVWTTTKLIARQDQYAYPVGRRRLEPVGVLVFSVVMITAFFQVALECLQRLFTDKQHTIVQLTLPAILIMASTVAIKGFCFIWCRLIKNSSVQALAQDALTDVVFNTFSIIFPLIGFYARVWWLDALGGLLLSLFVILNWASTSSEHIRNLTGAAATADQRNVLLYLAMRFAKPIQAIQGLQAYHTGDKLNVEVDIVLDEHMSLRDSHDLSESLQYVLESVPTVDRAFVHADYSDQNLPSHMNQQSD